MRVTRGRRQRGQLLVMFALMAVVVFGASALAVDLGLQTNDQKRLQNVTDSAALAGAFDIPGPGALAAVQQQAVQDALSTIGTNMRWPANWYGALSNGCSGSQYCVSFNYQSVLVDVSTPPKTPQNPQYGDTSHLEVELHQTVTNTISGVIGVPKSIVGAHSVGYHYGPHGAGGWALYSVTTVVSGNQAEAVDGDVYVGTGYIPQSQGKAGICAFELPDGSKGHVVFGAPQPPSNPPPKMKEPPGVRYGQTPACPNIGAITQEQPGGACPPGVAWDSSTVLCVANPPVAPPITVQPTVTAALPSCTLSKATLPGVYQVRPAQCPTLNLDYGNGSISCVSLVLDDGAVVNLVNAPKSGPPNSMTAYGSAGCPGASSTNTAEATADRSVIWASPTANVTLSQGSNGCCRIYGMTGSVEMPGGTISLGTNAALEILGQATVQNWDVQSGNHPNPAVIYDPANIPDIAEALRIVE